MVLSKSDATPRNNPTLTTHILRKCQDAYNFNQHFNYHSIIGKLNYLEESSWPYIVYIVHQYTQLSNYPIIPNGKAFNRIRLYLKCTDKMGLYICPRDRIFKLWADSYFIGNWFPEEAKNDSDTARSRSLFFVSYLVCTVMWKMQLWTEIYLSSTENEYIAPSKAMRKHCASLFVS